MAKQLKRVKKSNNNFNLNMTRKVNLTHDDESNGESNNVRSIDI